MHQPPPPKETQINRHGLEQAVIAKLHNEGLNRDYPLEDILNVFAYVANPKRCKRVAKELKERHEQEKP